MIDYVTNDTGTGIYAYIDVETLKPVYIGQTIQSFKKRDTNHRFYGDRWCPFDNELRGNQKKYVMVPLVYSDDPDSLNLLETFFIYYFDTIETGNRTWGQEHQSGMYHPRYRNDLVDDEIIKLYYDNNLSTTQIGIELSCPSKTVGERLKNNGLSLRNRGFARSLRVNKSGIYRVCQEKSERYKQGFIWAYHYRENGKRKKIRSVSLNKLEQKVKAKGLPWIRFDEEE